MPESFQYYSHQLTLSAHYINNLGEAIISKAGELHSPSPCTICLHFEAFTHGCTFCMCHLGIQISLLVSCTSCVWYFFHTQKEKDSYLASKNLTPRQSFLKAFFLFKVPNLSFFNKNLKYFWQNTCIYCTCQQLLRFCDHILLV